MGLNHITSERGGGFKLWIFLWIRKKSPHKQRLVHQQESTPSKESGFSWNSMVNSNTSAFYHIVLEHMWFPPPPSDTPPDHIFSLVRATQEFCSDYWPDICLVFPHLVPRPPKLDWSQIWYQGTSTFIPAFKKQGRNHDKNCMLHVELIMHTLGDEMCSGRAQWVGEARSENSMGQHKGHSYRDPNEHSHSRQGRSRWRRQKGWWPGWRRCWCRRQASEESCGERGQGQPQQPKTLP